MTEQKITPSLLYKYKADKRKITMLTAYDFYFARLIDECGCDLILVGDSLGTVIMGYETTVPVNLEDVIHHSRAVKKGVSRALVVGDMPFLSYQISKEEAMRNAGRLLKEGGVNAVKLEGGAEIAETVKYLTSNGVAVMGHVGLMPQRVDQLGGYKTQGKTPNSRKRVMDDALAIAASGVFALVLEGVEPGLASEITGRVKVPTIGIGAGPGCDGQVLVIYDLLNMAHSPLPKFVKIFADADKVIKEGVKEYLSEVRGGSFPPAR
ncbi:MAG TPA: 3-methyl-2-oxobutanoate hydroxymethyltransferase [Candidatus Wallbacteria bacterium]|nr:3-methyl-2-oxobutanoate hydroxymethyltransferase [Candidatus Wallbacteria bacterium]